MSNVLVTGGTGFLGTALVQRLLARGTKSMRVLVRTEAKGDALAKVVDAIPGAKVDGREADGRMVDGGEADGRMVERLLGTIATPAGADAVVEGADVIYHLAAAMGGAPADIFLNTVVASRQMLDAVVRAKRKPKIVLVSSFGVYGVADLPRGATVDEETPLETHPARRDPYSQAKLRQERLFRDYAKEHDLPLVVLRPGVIYGPRGGAFSSRVGLSLAGIFLSLGGDNLLPLSYVDNCAEGIAVAADSDRAAGQTYNLHDDDLPTCRDYLRGYEKAVRKLTKLTLPYPVLLGISSAVERYHAYSKGQLPAVFTPYKTKTTWKGNRFDNGKIKAIGWKQIVPTDEGMRRTFAWLRDNGKSKFVARDVEPAGASFDLGVTARWSGVETPKTEALMADLTTFLMFDDKAEEAAKLYLSIFPGKIVGGRGATDGMGVTFELLGRPFIAFNGGPHFKFSEGTSMFVSVDTQEEIDGYWEKLTADGGKESRCGWLTDKFGLSWQIIPKVLGELLGSSDREKAGRAMGAMLTMGKLDIAALQRAFDGH